MIFYNINPSAITVEFLSITYMRINAIILITITLILLLILQLSIVFKIFCIINSKLYFGFYNKKPSAIARAFLSINKNIRMIIGIDI